MENTTDLLARPQEPTFPKRDEFGLFPHVQYKRFPDGRIDWKKMFLPEHLYLRKDRKTQIEAKYNKPFEEIDVVQDGVSDEFLLSTLAGSRYLLWLRGYNSFYYNIHTASPDYAAVSCTINFIPDESGAAHSYSDVGHACPQSVIGDKIYKTFLLEIASNRAFVRTLRSFLNISIVSKEEIADFKEERVEPQNDNVMANNVRKKLKERNLNKKADLVAFFAENNIVTDPFDKLEDLPAGQLLTILGALSKGK